MSQNSVLFVLSWCPIEQKHAPLGTHPRFFFAASPCEKAPPRLRKFQFTMSSRDAKVSWDLANGNVYGTF